VKRRVRPAPATALVARNRRRERLVLMITPPARRA
jgi:hypothetical protein